MTDVAPVTADVTGLVGTDTEAVDLHKHSSQQDELDSSSVLNDRMMQCSMSSRPMACSVWSELTVFAIEAVKDVHKQLVNDVHDLVVVLIDRHLKIQAHELAQMSVSE